jgi:sugar/nucleoside kinase (ribokinase family)
MAGGVAVLGNVTLDVICFPVNDVPRTESISFQRSAVTPGGCGSNTAIRLAQLGTPVYLIACTGSDPAAELLHRSWQEVGVKTRFIRQIQGETTGVSVGLVDSDYQPRFVHTPGANAHLTPAAVEIPALIRTGVELFYLGGYFVLPGLLTRSSAELFQRLQSAGITTALDVVTSPAMADPDPLWALLPWLDYFFCNQAEARRMTGRKDSRAAAAALIEKGAGAVIIKQGEEGCLLHTEEGPVVLPPVQSGKVVDTTGAGDAFAAGFLSALDAGSSPQEACRRGNQEGSRTVGFLGAVKIP